MGKTYVSICLDKATHRHGDKPLEDCVIGYDEKGNEIKVSTLLAFYYALKDDYTNLVDAHNTLVVKFNALQAAYKANVAKTAMELVDMEEKIK